MGRKHNSLRAAISWFWTTRILGFFRYRLAGSFRRSLAPTDAQFAFERPAEPMTDPDPEGVTVILTAYRRAEYLAEQIAALRAQTRPPKEIWVWTNQSEEELRDFSALADRVVVSNANYLFWGRFALANLARTGFVAIFDDDILPQPKWLENCLNSVAAGYEGIFGGSGVILPAEGGYSSKHKVGWNAIHSDECVEVDLSGHCWFMRKEHLKYMWFEEPYTWNNGEDIHLSCMAFKHGGVRTWVPPHPDSDPEMWSCRPDFGKAVGRLKVATYKSQGHKEIRTEIVNHFRERGWNIVSSPERQASGSSPV